MAHGIKFVCSVVVMYLFHGGFISPIFVGFIDVLLILYSIWKLTEN